MVICVRTRPVDHDLKQICCGLVEIGRNMISTNITKTRNWSRSNWNTSRCNYSQWHPEKFVAMHFWPIISLEIGGRLIIIGHDKFYVMWMGDIISRTISIRSRHISIRLRLMAGVLTKTANRNGCRLVSSVNASLFPNSSLTRRVPYFCVSKLYHHCFR